MHQRFATLTCLAALVAALTAPAALATSQGTVAEGIGYASNHIEGIGIHAPGLDAVAIETTAWSTTDPEMSGHDSQAAYSEFHPAVATVDDGVMTAAPETRIRHATLDGVRYDWGTLGDVIVNLPSSSIPSGTAADTLDRVLAPVGGPPGQVPAGLITDGVVYVGRQYARIDPFDAETNAHSEAEEVSLLGGLVNVRDAGLGDHGTFANDESAGARTRELKIGSLTVLDLGALLAYLGVDLDLLPMTTHALIADTLDSPEGPTKRSLELRRFESWRRLAEMLNETVDGLEDALGLGATCDNIDALFAESVGTPLNENLDALGIERGSCLGIGNAVENLLDTVEALRNDVATSLSDLLADAALLSAQNASSRITTVAAVDPDGQPNASVTVDGELGQIMVGHSQIGQIDLQETAEEWNHVEQLANDRINAVLAIVGIEDVVRVRMVPELQQVTRVDDHTVSAKGALTLLEVTVASLDELADLSAGTDPADVPAGGGDFNLLGRAGSEPLTIKFGAMRAEATHTRPGVAVDCSTDCLDGGLVNRLWDPATGFGNPSDSTGATPRTGGSVGLLAFAVLAFGLVGLRLRLPEHRV